jgi:hypothetical protein
VLENLLDAGAGQIFTAIIEAGMLMDMRGIARGFRRASSDVNEILRIWKLTDRRESVGSGVKYCRLA